MLKLQRCRFGSKNLNKYRQFITKSQLNLIKETAKSIGDKKIIHLNSTAKGGGVAEILKSLVPLMQNVGINCEWYSIKAPVKFFTITKRIHNGLQGANVKISQQDFNYYLKINKQIGRLLSFLDFDLIVIHDPQPLAIINFLHKSPAIARIHLDLSTPNRKLLSLFKPLINEYEAIVFSLEQFIPQGITKEKTVIIEPAIDPLNPKNITFSKNRYQDIIYRVGVDPQKPIITQVSRFDPWKDPLGVIKAYFIAKEKIKDLQLVFVGLFIEKDSPDAQKVYRRAVNFAKGDPDIHLFFEEKQLPIKNDDLVNAFQSGSDIIIQKSIREGFGLTVTEAMYKGKIVIGGDAGGIKRQIENGQNGFIVKSPRQAARLFIKILENPQRYQKVGRRAYLSVKNRYLITRLLLDHLLLYKRFF